MNSAIHNTETKATATAKNSAQESSKPMFWEGFKALQKLQHFIGYGQRQALLAGLRGNEEEGIAEKILDIELLIGSMPKTYEQDGKGDDAVAYLHYFINGIDAYITEKDMEGKGTEQAMGWQDLGYGGELGYICIDELLAVGAELDLFFIPKTLKEIKAAHGA